MAGNDARHVVITGGSGFLGGYIVRGLTGKYPDWRITVIDLQTPDPTVVKNNLAGFIQADITSPSSIQKALDEAAALRQPDVVLHTAGIVPARQFRYSTNKKQWEKVRKINYEGTVNVLAATLRTGCKRFVYTSSCTAVIDDLDHDYFHMAETTPLGLATLHYGKSKGMAEQHVLDPKWRESAGLLACALRPSTIIGPGDTAVISLIHDLIAKGETYFIVGDGDNIYDFMCVENAALAHILAMENLLASDTPTAAGHAFFISNQEPVYFWDFLAGIWAQFGHVPRFRVRIPVSVAWLTGYCLECVTWVTGGASTLDRGSVKDGVRTQYSNNAKAIEILGYTPIVSLADGVRASCAVCLIVSTVADRVTDPRYRTTSATWKDKNKHRSKRASTKSTTVMSP